MRELNIDMTAPHQAARYSLLNTSLFPHLENGMSGSDETLDELQAKDPLALQVWRFFSKTKQSLPRQDRMENITWRMMHVNLQKWRKQPNQSRHDERTPVNGEFCRPPISTKSTSATITADSSSSSARHNSNSAANTPNAPSGIAQLRKATDQNASQPEPMNLDDFIFHDNVAPSAGFTPSLDTSKQQVAKPATRTTPAAIPIKSRKASGQHFVPQSVPVPPHQRTQDEFGYVTRHPRKTSIDERRVSADLLLVHPFLLFIANDDFRLAALSTCSFSCFRRPRLQSRFNIPS
jgi:GATA-binding protein